MDGKTKTLDDREITGLSEDRKQAILAKREANRAKAADRRAALVGKHEAKAAARATSHGLGQQRQAAAAERAAAHRTEHAVRRAGTQGLVAAEELANGDLVGAALHVARGASQLARAPPGVASTPQARADRRAQSGARRAASQGALAAEELARGDVVLAASHGARAVSSGISAGQQRQLANTPSGTVLKSGWAHKQAVSRPFFKNWKQRFLCLQEHALVWSEAERLAPKGSLLLKGARVCRSAVRPPSGITGRGALVVTESGGRQLHVQFSDVVQSDEWEASIAAAIADASGTPRAEPAVGPSAEPSAEP